jgi:hypothetical protein
MTDSMRVMFSRRFSAWQKVAALAPLLLLAVYLPGQVMLRCRIDGLLRPACCCPQAVEARETGPVVKAQDCCDREMTADQRSAAAPARTSAVDMTAAVSVTLPAAAVSVVLAEPAASAGAWQAHGPPRPGPRMVLLKRSFLI